MVLYNGILIIILINLTFHWTAAIGLPPLITIHPTKQIVYKDGDQLTLHCEANGTAPIKYYWKKNGRLLDLHYDQYVISMANPDKGTLIINSLTSQDQGYYQCFAHSPYGISQSLVADMRRAILIPHKNSDRVSTYTLFKGISFNLTCLTPKSFPPAEYYWEVSRYPTGQEAFPVGLDSRTQQDGKGGLYFAHMKMTDQYDGYMYRCVAHNSYLRQKSYSSYSKIFVQLAPRTVVHPKLVYSDPPWLKTADGVLGETLRLQCLFDGYPTPNVTWFKLDDNMPSLQRYSLLNAGTVLMIYNVTHSDAGDYVCTGAVKDQHTIYREPYKITVVIKSKPSFKSPETRPQNINKTVGTSVSFKCEVNGYPKADINWYINTVPVKDLANRRITLNNDRSMLTIENLCKKCYGNYSDVGVIQCNASNNLGYVYAEAYLNLIGKQSNIYSTDDEDGGTEIVPTSSSQLPIILIIGIVIGAIVLLSVVVFTVLFFYCRSKKLERELDNLKMKPKHHHKHHHHHNVPSDITSNSRHIPSQLSEGRYEKLSINATGITSLQDDEHSLHHPESYEQLKKSELPVDSDLTDDSYKYDYAYSQEGVPLFNGIIIPANSNNNIRPPSSPVHAYVDIIGAEEWDKH